MRRHLTSRNSNGHLANIYGPTELGGQLHSYVVQGSTLNDQASGITQGINNITMQCSSGYQQHVQPMSSQDVLVGPQDQQFNNDDARLDSDIRVDSDTLNNLMEGMKGGEFESFLDRNHQKQ